MALLVRGGKILGEYPYELARLEKLVTDLDLMGSGQMPSADDLADAPVIHRWRLAARAAPSLVGICSDHPRLHGPTIQTSDLWVIAPDEGWARTLSPFYRLGERDPDGQQL